MVGKFRIGLFTSAWDEVAWDLVEAVTDSVRTGFIPNAEIAFVFVSRELGETKFGDFMLQRVLFAGLRSITLSSLNFQSEMRQKGREAEKNGDLSIIETWRAGHDTEILNRIPPTDIDVALGWMWRFGEKMCERRKIINLHPAMPGGPKGTYKDVIWQLIRSQAKESGVMMHLITPELDRGPAIAYCRYPIRGGDFDQLWQTNTVQEQESEDNPLFAAIRKAGVTREFPMVLWTLNSIAAGKILIENGVAMDDKGLVLMNGYDLTPQIESFLAATVIINGPDHVCDNQLPPGVFKDHQKGGEFL